MAKHILQYDEFEYCGRWTCMSTKDVGKIGNQWYTPARALGMPLVEYVKLIITQFKPDHVTFHESPPNGLLLYSWNNQADMRKFKNWINKELRRVYFYVD